MPGFVATERMAIELGDFGFDAVARACRSRTPAASAPCSRRRSDPLLFSGKDIYGPTFYSEHELVDFD